MLRELVADFDDFFTVCERNCFVLLSFRRLLLTSVMSDQYIPNPAQVHFRAILLPHRSLGRKGFIVLMGVISAVSFVTGLAFYSIGAWPVLGFFGLDVFLIYGAFRLSYRAARIYETVELWPGELKLTRVLPSGNAQSWTFNPYWVRLELDEHETRASHMRLRSHGRVLTFGNFLSNDEKRGFVNELASALHTLRNATPG